MKARLWTLVWFPWMVFGTFLMTILMVGHYRPSFIRKELTAMWSDWWQTLVAGGDY